MKRYNPSDIEQKWQQIWDEEGTYAVDLHDTSRPKYYGFSMLPGITGAGIHIGHGRTYQFSDIKVRAKRQQGYNAYHPIGWDSFGLPVENYAIKVGKKPRDAHDEAKENFVRQLKRLGFSFDWSKEISTADPEYYKWTQWIFAKLYEHDLAYQKEQPQWWCETDNTVLANEQVEGGKCWRCGNQVVKRNLKQWFFRITAYADEILEATDALDWTDMVKTMQKNWIGRSMGAEVEFAVDGSDEIITVFTTRPDTLFGASFVALAPENPLAKTLATAEAKARVEEYITVSTSKSEVERQENKQKTGVFTGSYAVNPVNGAKLPIWVADYVLGGYGTGALMAVPAHDERDYEFAEKFKLPIIQVVAPRHIDATSPFRPDKETIPRNVVACVIKHPDEDKYLMALPRGGDKWAPLMGGIEGDESIEETVRREIIEETGYVNIASIQPKGNVFAGEFFAPHKDLNRIAYNNVVYVELGSLEQDLSLAVDYDEQETKWVSLDEFTSHTDSASANRAVIEALEEGVQLWTGEGRLINSGIFDGYETSDAREEIVAWLEQQGTGRTKITYKMHDWLISRQRYWGAPIPIVHVEGHTPIAVNEKCLPVVLPEVEDFKPTGGNTSVLAQVDDWVRVWVNVETGETASITEPKPTGDAWVEGRRETDTLDGYACSSWYFIRYVDPFNANQAWDPQLAEQWLPVDYYNGADHAVAHLLYSRFWMRFFYKLGLVPTPEPFKRMMYNAYIMAPDGQKMSKSKGNVIDPMEIMDSGYGADALRVYEMFIAPYDMDAPWDTRGVPGTYRFLSRVWNLTQEYIEASETGVGGADGEILKLIHGTIKKVTSDIEDEKFNTAVAAMMELVNRLYKIKEANGVAKNDAWQFAVESLLLILAPFAPHLAEELWHQIGHTDTIHRDHWPQWDDALLVADVMTIAVQVNGKLRAKVENAADAGEDAVKAAALAEPNVIKFLDNKQPVKVIYIPGRLVNIVVK